MLKGRKRKIQRVVFVCRNLFGMLQLSRCFTFLGKACAVSTSACDRYTIPEGSLSREDLPGFHSLCSSVQPHLPPHPEAPKFIIVLNITWMLYSYLPFSVRDWKNLAALCLNHGSILTDNMKLSYPPETPKGLFSAGTHRAHLACRRTRLPKALAKLWFSLKWQPEKVP